MSTPRAEWYRSIWHHRHRNHEGVPTMADNELHTVEPIDVTPALRAGFVYTDLGARLDPSTRVYLVDGREYYVSGGHSLSTGRRLDGFGVYNLSGKALGRTNRLPLAYPKY